MSYCLTKRRKHNAPFPHPSRGGQQTPGLLAIPCLDASPREFSRKANDQGAARNPRRHAHTAHDSHPPTDPASHSCPSLRAHEPGQLRGGCSSTGAMVLAGPRAGGRTLLVDAKDGTDEACDEAWKFDSEAVELGGYLVPTCTLD